MTNGLSAEIVEQYCKVRINEVIQLNGLPPTCYDVLKTFVLELVGQLDVTLEMVQKGNNALCEENRRLSGRIRMYEWMLQAND